LSVLVVGEGSSIKSLIIVLFLTVGFTPSILEESFIYLISSKSFDIKLFILSVFIANDFLYFSKKISKFFSEII